MKRFMLCAVLMLMSIGCSAKLPLQPVVQQASCSAITIYSRSLTGGPVSVLCDYINCYGIPVHQLKAVKAVKIGNLITYSYEVDGKSGTPFKFIAYLVYGNPLY